MTQPDLDLGVVGNGSFGALVDKHARVVWSCLPTFDGDPTFCALLSPNQQEGGDFAIELEDLASTEQEYLSNTAILRTVLRDAHGGALEILDFAPRWRQNDRFYRPVSLIRHAFSSEHRELLADYQGGSLRQYLSQRGLPLTRTFSLIGARLPSRDEAARLLMPRHAPLLSVQTLSRDLAGRPVELSLSTSRADRFQYQLAL
mgnify:CR=1 FL=1